MILRAMVSVNEHLLYRVRHAAGKPNCFFGPFRIFLSASTCFRRWVYATRSNAFLRRIPEDRAGNATAFGPIKFTKKREFTVFRQRRQYCACSGNVSQGIFFFFSPSINTEQIFDNFRYVSACIISRVESLQQRAGPSALLLVFFIIKNVGYYTLLLLLLLLSQLFVIRNTILCVV